MDLEILLKDLQKNNNNNNSNKLISTASASHAPFQVLLRFFFPYSVLDSVTSGCLGLRLFFWLALFQVRQCGDLNNSLPFI